MLLIIDNYDSFTFNLVQYFQMLDQDVRVFANDKISLEEASALAPSHLVISPGPKRPADAGISMKIINYFHQRIPILGVCLGHQCLAEAFGGVVIPAPQIIHGKTSAITHHRQKLFSGLPSPFAATRYHSLAVEPDSLPSCFSIDAWTGETVMAISHRDYPIFGLQFHPESILSEHGLPLLKNFLQSGSTRGIPTSYALETHQ